MKLGNPHNTGNCGGSSGARSRDLRIKSPSAIGRYLRAVAAAFVGKDCARNPTLNHKVFCRPFLGDDTDPLAPLRQRQLDAKAKR